MLPAQTNRTVYFPIFIMARAENVRLVYAQVIFDARLARSRCYTVLDVTGADVGLLGGKVKERLTVRQPV